LTTNCRTDDWRTVYWLTVYWFPGTTCIHESFCLPLAQAISVFSVLFWALTGFWKKNKIYPMSGSGKRIKQKTPDDDKDLK
jgi:hypothetical protein